MTKTFKNLLINVMLVVCLLSFVAGMLSFNQNKAFAASSTIIFNVDGASVNVTSQENSGLRFKAKIDKSKYNALVNTEGVEKVELGMMTVPTDMVNDASVKGKSFTIEGMSTYAPLNGYAYYSVAQSVAEDADGYYFYMTIPKISQANYNRKFSARAFIKVTASELDNAEFTLYNGAYYSYADYSEDKNAHSVYDVAYTAYIQDPDDEDEGVQIAKGFIDGVAVVAEENGVVKIANNDENYTSPYTIEKDGNNYYVSANPSGLTYNGQRCKNLYAVNDEVMVSSLLSKGATITSKDASIQSTGYVAAPGYISQTLDKIMDNNYIALTGEYGVGTYMDFYFTGNNMPSVMYFADKVNGNMSGYSSYTGSNGTAVGVNSGEKGLLITNGSQGQNSTAAGNALRNNYAVFGPNRLHINTTSIGGALYSYISRALMYKEYSKDNTTYNAFTQTGLIEEYNSTNFKYTVGTFNSKGILWIDATLYDVDNQTLVSKIKQSLNISVNEVCAGNIIIYGAVKGSSSTTDFIYTKPYVVNSNLVTDGATFNADGSVTLAQATQGGDGGGNHVYQRTGDQHKYIAFEGKYGVGTYMDFTFTGANMPQVMFFANNINGYILNYHSFDNSTKVGNVSDDKGVLFSNGLWTTDNHGQRYYSVWGPNRIKVASDSVTGAFQHKLGAALYSSAQNIPLSYYTLNSTYANTKLKYIVGTYDKDGYLGIDAKLYNAETGKIIYGINQVTTLATSSVEADNIVVYGMPKAGSTTFTYSEPYKSEPSEFGNGATFNSDETVTLAGNVSAGGFAHHITQHSNSYVGIKGNYGIGTYIDVTFTGNNMPNIMFFADDINGNLTSDGGKGVVLMNGNTCANSNSNYLRAFGIYGPDRITNLNTSAAGNTYSDNVSRVGYLLGFKSDNTTPADYPYLCQLGLAQTPDTTYKLTVGTLVSDTGKLIVDVYLYNVTTNSVVYDVQVPTSLSAGEVEAGSIVLYGAIKGTSQTTTFAYGEPYMSEEFSANEISFETEQAASFTAKNGVKAEVSADKAYLGARALKVSSLNQVSVVNLYGFKPLNNYNVNDIISLSFYAYLDAANGSLLITDANGNAYKYLDQIQTAITAGEWTKVVVDIPIGQDVEKYLEIAFKVNGIADLSDATIYIDNISIQYNSLLGYSLYRNQAGLGGNTVYMLPCTAGNQNMSFVVVNSAGEIIVIDGGYTADAQFLINMLKELQPNAEKPVVTAWLITHGHSDHIEAISAVINSGEVVVNAIYHDMPTEEAWAAAKAAGYDQGSGDADTAARVALYEAIASANITVVRPQTGVSLVFGSAKFDILYTPTDDGTYTSNFGNNSSVIYKLVTSEKSVLFLGDAGTDASHWLVANKAQELDSDIVQMAHHGQNGVRQDCYQAISPSIALWPTPQWVWDNRGGTGTLETPTVRGWMDDLGCVNYVSKDGIIKIS